VTESITPEITLPTNKPIANDHEGENKTGSFEEEHTPCTPATVTVCPIQTPSPIKPDPSTTDPPIGADMISTQAMGAVTGILIVLLLLMTSGYIYIYYTGIHIT
jgi:hypothetical protein